MTEIRTWRKRDDGNRKRGRFQICDHFFDRFPLPRVLFRGTFSGGVVPLCGASKRSASRRETTGSGITTRR
jgi:hypothetical protein